MFTLGELEVGHQHAARRPCGAHLTKRAVSGLGRLFADAVKADDLPTIQGTVLFSAFFIVALTLVVDLVYKLIDPRVRLGEAR